MISNGDGVGNHTEAKGSEEKNAHIFPDSKRPGLPTEKRIFAREGAKGIDKQATRPSTRDQKHTRGSTRRLDRGATRETLLK